MSTLKVTTLQDTAGSNSSTSAEIYSGRAKAWVNFNGQSTVSIRRDFNVNTVTDVATGEYTINLSNSVTGNYAVIASTGDPSNNTGNTWMQINQSQTTSSPNETGVAPTTTAFRLRVNLSNGSAWDNDQLAAAIFG